MHRQEQCISEASGLCIGWRRYISNSSIRWDFLLWFLVAGAGGGIVGELVVKEQIQKLGR